MAKFNKKKLPSRHTSLGADRAPHRSFYYAMGETEKDVAKPFIGVVSTWNEAAPCNIALMRQAQSVKKGVRSNSMSFIRQSLSKRMTTRGIPNLEFIYDHSIDHNDRITELLNSAFKK